MQRDKNGFTLLEVIIVIAITTMLWGVAYTMFYQSRGVSIISRNKLEMYQYARIAMDGISRDLKGATLKDNTDFFRSFTIAEAFGLGTSTGNSQPRSNSSILTFLSLTPNGSSTPVTLITYYLSNNDELMKSEYNDTSYIYGTVTNFSPGSSTYYKLAANMNYFECKYNAENTWESTWDSTSGTTTGRLPDSVKVTLQIYGAGTGNTVEIGTYTAIIALPYRITH